MSTSLTIHREQFPQAIDVDAVVGQTVTLTVKGIIRRIEDDLVDVTAHGGRPEYMTGAQEIEVTITEISR